MKTLLLLIAGVWSIGEVPAEQQPKSIPQNTFMSRVKANPKAFVRYRENGQWVYMLASDYERITRPTVKKKYVPDCPTGLT